MVCAGNERGLWKRKERQPIYVLSRVVVERLYARRPHKNLHMRSSNTKCFVMMEIKRFPLNSSPLWADKTGRLSPMSFRFRTFQTSLMHQTRRPAHVVRSRSKHAICHQKSAFPNWLRLHVEDPGVKEGEEMWLGKESDFMLAPEHLTAS